MNNITLANFDNISIIENTDLSKFKGFLKNIPLEVFNNPETFFIENRNVEYINSLDNLIHLNTSCCMKLDFEFLQWMEEENFQVIIAKLMKLNGYCRIS